MKNEKTLIISAFPGCGKSYCANKESNKFNGVCDLDSSSYSHIKTGELNPDFPNNYIKAIKEKYESGDYEIIFVSTHEMVRNALQKAELPYVLVYPNLFQKKDYIQRYKKRGNDKKFISLISGNWEEWINSCRLEEYPEKFELPYLSCKYLNAEMIDLIKIMIK